MDQTSYAALSVVSPCTLQLFQNPVKTLHGQTYERTAIEDWLQTKSTDPMTGEILKIKALFPDEDMKIGILRCNLYHMVC